MYTILNGKTAVIDCDDLQTAVRFVQSLESGMNRLKEHSPYTIVKTDNLDFATTGGDTRPRVGATDLVCQITE